MKAVPAQMITKPTVDLGGEEFDDETDEDMLRAVRERARSSVTVAVEPVLHARPTSAEFFVGSPKEMLELLDSVLLLRTGLARLD